MEKCLLLYLCWTWDLTLSPLICQAACGDDDALRDLGAAATAVTEALNNLIHGIKEDIRNAEGDKYDDAVEAILAATERLFRYSAVVLYRLFLCR